MTVRPSILGPLGPFAIKISGLVDSITQPPSACLPVRCGGGRADASAAAQLPQFCQSRRSPYSADTSKFLTKKGPVSPRQEGPATQILPAGRNCPDSRRASPVMGVWGADDCERPLREGAHRNQPPAILWFLSDRSERNTRFPAGRNTPLKPTHSPQKIL